jgi:eukaryotic-like serine/threonine-protein kinase
VEKEVLTLQRKLLGDEHPEVPKTLSFLGQLMRQQGNKTEGRAVLKTALSIQQKNLGVDHADSLETLRVLGWLLESDGELAEAEIAYREGFVLRCKKSGPEDRTTLAELESLVRVLVAQNKFSEAEQQLATTLTLTFVRQPASANLLVLRTDLLGRQGRWQEAAADAALILEYQPAEHYRYHTLAGLLAVTHNRSAYEQLCRKILTTFTNTMNPYVAERMAKDCMLLPDVEVDLQSAARLADKSVTLENSNDSMPYSQAAKALAEYRQGHFVEAINWAKKPLNHPEVYARSHAYAVLSMAYWQIGQKDEARAMLVEGKALAENTVPGRDAEKIGGAWVAWLFSQIQLDEATALIQSVATTDALPGKP